MWVSLDVNVGVEIKGIIYIIGGIVVVFGNFRLNFGEDFIVVFIIGMDCVEGDGVGVEVKKKGCLLMDGFNDVSVCVVGVVWIGGIVILFKGGKE